MGRLGLSGTGKLPGQMRGAVGASDTVQSASARGSVHCGRTRNGNEER